MNILNTTSLESNKRVKINFAGGDLLKAELRDGTQYCSKDADLFMIPLMQEYRKKYPNLPLYLRGDSGFAAPGLYEACEANRLQVHALAYNLFNWFRRIVLAANLRKQRIDTIRLKLLKIAARAIHSAGYITFKLCSSCPYKDEFFETLANIRALKTVAVLE